MDAIDPLLVEFGPQTHFLGKDDPLIVAKTIRLHTLLETWLYTGEGVDEIEDILEFLGIRSNDYWKEFERNVHALIAENQQINSRFSPSHGVIVSA